MHLNRTEHTHIHTGATCDDCTFGLVRDILVLIESAISECPDKSLAAHIHTV